MLNICLPNQRTVRKLSFYLAMEEYVARYIPSADDCLFLWQVAPTVIFGRNQQLENEVNVDYCRRHNIQMFRRKSGGGCVYADESNLMLSYITRNENVGLAFNNFINMMLLVLHKMGVDAVGSSHNDVMIADRKVSGTASYHLPEGNIVHGTLLYDTNMEFMLNAITPGPEKLEQKGIQSVRQRITLLKDHTTLTLEEVKTLILETLCEKQLMLTDEQIADIEQLEQTYIDEDFIRQL